MQRSEVFMLIFIIIFLGVYSVMLGGVASAFNINEDYSGQPSSGYYGNGSEPTFFEVCSVSNDGLGVPTGLTSYYVTGNSAGTKWGYITEQSEANTHLYLKVFFKNFPDYLRFEQSWGFNLAQKTITIQDIMKTYDSVSNSASFKIEMKNTYTVTVTGDANTTLYNDLNDGQHFTMQVFGKPTPMPPPGIADGFGIMLSMLTLSAPGIDPVIQFLLSIPIYACVGYLFIRFVVMFIPTLNGA